MRSPLLLIVLALTGCAASSQLRRPDEVSARVYNLPEEVAQSLVREALARRGIALHPTENPHLLATAPKQTTIGHVTLVPTMRGLTIAEEPIYTHERTWIVAFSPVSASETAVWVVRGDQLAFANGAERSTTMQSAMAAVTTDSKLPLDFVRDREEEAVVAAELDGQVSVEVSEAGQPNATEPPAEALPDPIATTQAAPGACRVVASQLGDALAPGHLVLLSDPLGADEPWRVLDDLSCLASSQGLPVTIAISIPTAEQGAVNAYLSSAGTPAARRAFLKSPFWNRPWQDGRSSVAALEEIERIRVRRAAGEPITLLAVDSELPGNPRQAHTASALLRHRSSAPDRVILGLLGNAMISRRHGAEWDEHLLTVGARLAAVLPEQTHAFDVSFWSGSHWACHLEEHGHLRCGTWSVNPGPAQVTQALTPRPFFRRFEHTSRQGFDGIYFVGGELTASPPALEAMRVDEGTLRSWR